CTALEAAPLLPPARPHAVPRCTATTALPGARALLPAGRETHRPLLRRALDVGGQGSHPQRQAAGSRRIGDRRALGQWKTSGMKRAASIGAGFGRRCRAIRLQSAGMDTPILAARDLPGGRDYVWHREGYTFDAGPTVIPEPACLQELWALSGADMAADVELVPVTPFYRLNWPDGTNFDYTNDDPALMREIAALDPADVEGYRRFLCYSAGVYVEGYEKLGAVPFLDFGSMLKA